HREDELKNIQKDVVATTRRGQVIRAKTFRQQQYIRALRSSDLTFCTGPAGTGKTFLAAMVAVKALMNEEYEKLILTRPAVEAGEKLGFLPGDLQEKVNPYLRPLYDALHELLDPERIPHLMEKGVIEVAPLAYMRGRTLSNAFVILDEAQNTTPAQMKMVLTRLGFHSRMVVTGDVTQTDLPRYQDSGLAMATKILKKVEGIEFCELTKADVVRHALVQRIVAAYEKFES
ncbi:MAG: PhoH family protein, partial [Cyanobacteria bacterium J06576_12]